jgi:hypothetical protein
MRNITLYFEQGELTEVNFGDGSATNRISVRGKTSGPLRSAGSFQWTSAVKALALLLLKTCASPAEGLIRGDGNSLAASLDYAISKQPVWLTEMFGCDQQGISLARRLILRTNPERKRPGPVTLGINQLFMSASAIRIFVNGSQKTGEELVNLIDQLERLSPVVSLAKAA